MWKKATLRSAVATACACAGWSGLSAQSRGLDACSVLTREEIKAVSHDPGQLDPGANSDPDKVTTCYWRNFPKGSVSLWPKVSPDEPKGLGLKQLLDHGRKARAVAGLGDDAVFMENPDGSAGGTLFVRVGHRLRRTEQGPWDAAASRAGLHPTVLPVLAEREIAALGSDGNSDTAPSAAAGVEFPIHVLAVNALGLHLLDYLQFTELARACASAGRWSFLCVIAPLRLPTATGSPVNPIAIL